MIIAIAAGRAGNQMFQLAAIESSLASAGERMILVNFSELENLFPSLSDFATTLPMPRLLARWYPYVDSFLRHLARWRVVGSVTQISLESPEIARKRGLFPITFFWGGYCQDETFIKPGILQRLFESDVLRGEIASKGTSGRNVEEEMVSCFVHIRRGDYESHPSPEFSALLPSEWFVSQMQAMREHVSKVHFYIFSDDLGWVTRQFAHLPDATILDFDSRETFRFMSSCDAGILSPSTFSWWAAYFASQHSPLSFIAPQFWTGWRMGHWHPHSKIESSFLRYAEVEQGSSAGHTE